MAYSEDQAEIAERVAVLEERTKPQPKSFLDQIKEWGGIVSLVIALAYSFPIGLWDRFITSGQEKQDRELARVRGVISESTEIITEAGRSLPNISDPSFRDMVQRAFNTKLHILMASNEAAFTANRDLLTPQELLVVAYNFQSTGKVEVAMAYYDLALKRTENDPYLSSELLRLKGQALFIHPTAQNLAAARKSLRTALEKAKSLEGVPGAGAKIGVLSDWGRLELMNGDWQCGHTLLAEAIQLIEQYQHLINDQGNLRRLLQHQLTTIPRRSDQRAEGCEGV